MAKHKSVSYSADDFISTALDTARAKFGDDVYVASDHEAKQLVIPLPHLALRWLIESNGWPLSRITGCRGEYGTFKSCFAFQLANWFLQATGIVSDIDTENKTSNTLRDSILDPVFTDKNDISSKRLQHFRARTINAWQQYIESQMTLVEAAAKKMNGFPWPILWIIDSLMGVDSVETREKFRDEGEAAGRTFDPASLLISQFFRSMSGLVVGYPITLHVTHQEKPDLSNPGTFRAAGGRAYDFMATLDLRFKKGPFVSTLGAAARYDQRNDFYAARTIRIIVRKNSMGTDGKELIVLVKWNFIQDPVTGEQRQVTWFDWSAVTAHILAQNTRELKEAGLFDVMKVDRRGEGMCLYVAPIHAASKDLPKSESEALPATEFGKLVEANTELIPLIERAFKIQQHPVFGKDAAIEKSKAVKISADGLSLTGELG